MIGNCSLTQACSVTRELSVLLLQALLKRLNKPQNSFCVLQERALQPVKARLGTISEVTDFLEDQASMLVVQRNHAMPEKGVVLPNERANLSKLMMEPSSVPRALLTDHTFFVCSPTNADNRFGHGNEDILLHRRWLHLRSALEALLHDQKRGRHTRSPVSNRPKSRPLFLRLFKAFLTPLMKLKTVVARCESDGTDADNPRANCRSPVRSGSRIIEDIYSSRRHQPEA